MNNALFRALFLVSGAALALSSCLSATEIRLHVHTNMPCTDATQWKGVAVYAGAADATLETRAPVLTSTACDASGQVGTLVVVPSGAKDEQVGLRIVGGIAHAPEECAAHSYQGCIVARRTVRFSPHGTLDLDVALTAECVGQGCDAAHTCIAGTCSVTESVAPVPQPVPVDDAGLAPGDPRVRCGDNGVFCPTHGNVCCLTVDREAGTATGECTKPDMCRPGSIVLNCDDESDCEDFRDDAGHPGICNVPFTVGNGAGDQYLPGDITTSECLSYPTTTTAYQYPLELCESREACGKDKIYPCQALDGIPTNPMPHYHVCRIFKE